MTEQAAVTKAEIMNMAKELGLALAQSQEIRNYREAERKMAGEEEACRLTRIFREAHKDLVKSQMEPESREEEIAERTAALEKADRDMKANPLIAEYYRAGYAFNTLIYQINQLLKFYCMEPGEDSQFAGGDCSGCKGCPGRDAGD